MELQGKVIDFMGDSITEGIGVKDIANCRYDKRMEKMYGIVAQNYGISGTRCAYQTLIDPSRPQLNLFMAGRIFLMDRHADIVLVYGGVNDYLHGDAPIGNADDTMPYTYCGAVNFMMDKLKNNLFRNKTIVFLTPSACCFDGHTDEIPSNQPMKKPDARELLFYVNYIIEAGKRFGIPVLDMYHAMPDPKQPGVIGKYTDDGLHWNDAGHEVLAKTVGDFLLSL